MKRNLRKILFIMSILAVLSGVTAMALATPHKERYLVDGKEIVIGEEGNALNGNFQKHKEKKEAPEKPLKGKNLNMVQSLSGNRTIYLAFTFGTGDVMFQRVLPGFISYWAEKTGETVDFVTGYGKLGLDTVTKSVSDNPVQVMIAYNDTDMTSRGYRPAGAVDRNSIVCSSPQVFLVRRGNPKQIVGYRDLEFPALQILHTNPLFSTGSGPWAVYGIYGSALMEPEGDEARQENAGYQRLKAIEQNSYYQFTTTQDVLNRFEEGLGDVLITSEDVAINAVKANDNLEMVIPSTTIVADYQVYKLDENISEDNQPVVDAFIEYLYSSAGQEAFAEYGYRPSDPSVLSYHPEFQDIYDPFQLDSLGEPTDLKKDLLLDTWVGINNEIALQDQKSD